jgi:DNA invertase Pin-like site-specific DNA recombinase
MKTVIGYIRVSTDDQQLGPEAQQKALTDWCRVHDAQLVETFTDHGVSGAAELDRRPGLMQALAALRTRSATILLVAKTDRLARDGLLARLLEREVQRTGARVLSTDGVGNDDTPEGRLMRGIQTDFAEYERALIRMRTKAALSVKKARGERVGQIPYGWQLGADGKVLQPHTEEQLVLELMQLWRMVEALSYRQIARRLNLHGVAARPRPKKGVPAGEGPPSRWHYPAVRRLCLREIAA